MKRKPVMPSVDSHNDITGQTVPMFLYQIVGATDEQCDKARRVLARFGQSDLAEALGL